MTFPSDIYEQRELENLPGLEYDPLNKKTLFAEDIINLGNEVTAIENALGPTVTGEFDTVSERLDSMSGGGGGGGGVLEKIVLTSGISEIEFSTPISMDSYTYLKMQCVIPGTMGNASMRLIFEDDMTPGHYPRNRMNVAYSTTNVQTATSSNLLGLGTAADNTSFMDIEMIKTVGHFLNCSMRAMNFSTFGDPEQRYDHLKYTGTTSDITNISLRVDSGVFPAGSVFVLRSY